jgi:hypothetical protein
MATVDECVPGRRAKVGTTGVARIRGKTGTIVEVSRIRRPPGTPLVDKVMIDVPGHGEVVVGPGDLEVLPD